MEAAAAAHRLLLYVYLLSGRAEFVHTFAGLVRDVVQGLLGVCQDLVRTVRRTVGQFFHLSIQLPYHPLQTLATLARIGANVLRQHVLHVPVQWDALDLHRRFLFQQRFGRVGRVWNVAERFVH